VSFQVDAGEALGIIRAERCREATALKLLHR
jgi:hypothetical protein